MGFKLPRSAHGSTCFSNQFGLNLLTGLGGFFECLLKREIFMRPTSAYLILSTPGTSNSLKSAGTGEGELGMTAGTPSLQRKGTSNTGHASLLIQNIGLGGHDVFLSFYPRDSGLLSVGVFRSTRSDGLFNPDDKTIYRIDNLNGDHIQLYLRRLNAQIQTGILKVDLPKKISDLAITTAARSNCQATLTSLSADERGYDAFRHNCTTVVIEALRAGGLTIAAPWFLETPTWLNKIALASTSCYIPVEHADFHRLMASRTVERPHTAFPFEASRQLLAEFQPQLPPPEVVPLPLSPAPVVTSRPGGEVFNMSLNPMHAVIRPVTSPVVISSPDLLRSTADAKLPHPSTGVDLDLTSSYPARTDTDKEDEKTDDHGSLGIH